MSNYVAAIDLGTTKVVTIIGEKSMAGIKIVAYSEAPSNGVMRGEVVNIQRVLDSLTPTIKAAQGQIEEYEIKEVFVGIAGQNIRCDANSVGRNRSNPNVLISKAEIDNMLDEVYNTRVPPGERVIHVVPQSYNVDEHMGIEDPVGMDGKHIDGNYRLFIGRVNSAAHSKAVIERANLQLKKLILEPIASAKAILTDEEMELGVAMVDIGGGTTDVLIYENNIIRHTAVIPFGGNSITEDIRQKCGISYKNAEALKKLHGTCISEFAPEEKVIAITTADGIVTKELSLKNMACTIEARASEIISTVLYEIEKSSYKDKLKSGIVLTGGTANLNHIQNLTKKITGYNVRIALPDSNSIMVTSREEVYKPSASTAVGLIIKGFEYYDSMNKKVEESETAPSTIFPGGNDAPLKVIPEPKAPRQKKGIKGALSGLIDDIFKTPDNNEA